MQDTTSGSVEEGGVNNDTVPNFNQFPCNVEREDMGSPWESRELEMVLFSVFTALIFL